MATNLTKDNHYVSQAYLKRWEISPGQVFVYRILASHENVPIWENKSIKGIAHQQHLYTRQFAGSENDELEQWFSREFETPAEGAIQRAVNGDSLTPEEWRAIVRYMAMHDVRTPARLVEYLDTAAESMSQSLSEVLRQLPNKLAELKQGGIEPAVSDPQNAALPLRITTDIEEGAEFGTLKAETAVGRASWLWAIKHILNNTSNVLHQHKWTIMRPAKGMNWFTTDKPVLRLNYYSHGHYDFKGGWAKNGGEIIFPLSAEHMLYTQIGSRPPVRGTRFTVEQTQLLRRFSAEHAHRYIFAQAKDSDLPTLRPRTVDPAIFKSEREQWERWHAEQIESERYLFPN